MIYPNPKIDYEKKYDQLSKDYQDLLKINNTLKMEIEKMNEFHRLLLELSEKNVNNESNITDTFLELKNKFFEYQNDLESKRKDIEIFKDILKSSKDTFDSIVSDLKKENEELLKQIEILKGL